MKLADQLGGLPTLSELLVARNNRAASGIPEALNPEPQLWPRAMFLSPSRRSRDLDEGPNFRLVLPAEISCTPGIYQTHFDKNLLCGFRHMEWHWTNHPIR